jgi:Na+-translocating ferredoxin:NAD+ oxidoreductase RNF subunit RnfB
MFIWFGMQKIEISPYLCTRIKLARSGCQECLSACPVHAIEFADQTLRITSTCAGCECCVAACPNEVFSLVRGGKDVPQLDQDTTSVYCSKLVPGRIDLSKPSALGILPCIGSLPLHLLLNRITTSKQPLKAFTGDCDQCEMKAGFLSSEKKRKAIWSQLSLLKIPIPPVTVQRGSEQDRKDAEKRLLAYTVRPEEKSVLGRRDFLMGLRNPASLRGIKGSSKAEPEGGRLPGKRPPRWVSNLTRLIKEDRAGVGGEEKVSFFSEMGIEESCTGCEVCASFCPTGALRGEVAERRFHLEWTAAHCSGCRLCEEICPEKAIRLSPGLPVRKIREETRTVMLFFYQHHCPDCQQEYRSRSSDTRCPYCQKQKELLEDYSRILYGETEKTFPENS